MKTQMKAQIDKLLSGVSSIYMPENFICEALLPFIGVSQYSGKLGKYGTSHLRIHNSITGGNGEFRRVQTLTYTTQGYDVESHGLSGLVSKRDYANFDAPFDAERDETMGISSVLLLEKEKGLADTLSDTAIVTQNVTLTGTDKYSDKENSAPVDDFEVARAAVKAGCGKAPDTAWLNWNVWNKLRFHPQLLDSLGFKYDRPGGLKEAELASAMGVKRIFIVDAMFESAKEGQTSALVDVWGNHIWFGVCPENAQVMQTSLGYRVGIKGQQPRKVYKEAKFNPPGSTEILVEDEYDYLLSNLGAVYLIKDAI